MCLFYHQRCILCPTLRSNRARELAATREASLGDRKLVFCFWKIYALKNTFD